MEAQKWLWEGHGSFTFPLSGSDSQPIPETPPAHQGAMPVWQRRLWRKHCLEALAQRLSI